MRYQVTAIPKGDMHLWAVPCGEAENAPKNQWFEVKEGQSYSIGRYGSGTCDVFAITHERFVARLTAREESGPNWLADAKAASVPCEGLHDLYFQTEIADSDPRSSADVALRVQALDAKQCKLVAANDAQAPSIGPATVSTASPTKSRCGCGVRRAEDALVPSGLVVACFMFARSRRNRSRARG